MVSLYWPETLSSTALSHVNIVALTLLVVFYLVRYYHKRKCFANIPPGPKPWPVVGNFGGFLTPPLLRRILERQQSKNPVSILTELGGVYGNIYSLFVGSHLVVVLNDYEVVRDALSNHAGVFSDRPDIPVITIMTQRKGKTHSLTITSVQSVCMKSSKKDVIEPTYRLAISISYCNVMYQAHGDNNVNCSDPDPNTLCRP